MDEKKNYKAAPSSGDEKPVDNSKKVDDFFDKLNKGGALESSSEGGARIKSEGYDPDYIDLADYGTSDTGYVSLKNGRGADSDVRVYNKGDVSKANGSKSAQASKKTAAVKKTGAPRLLPAGLFGKAKASKAKAVKSEGEVRSKSRRVWGVIGRVALFACCIVIIAVCGVSIAAAMYLAQVTVDDDEILDLNSLELSYATRLMAYNSETEEWEEYERLFGDENRVWVAYEEMPGALIEVTVASEDQRFWEHAGVDWIRTIGAFMNEYVPFLRGRIYSTTQGGSTITQQLVKNITEETEVEGSSGALRKLREIYRALTLERKYSKEQILEAYLNTIRLGNTVAGIEAGANYYFNTTTSELTYAQSAAIIVITKYPTAYNPFIDPDENKNQRENVVLWMMHENGALSDTEYQAALSESATFTFDEPGVGRAGGVDSVYSYFTETAIDEVLDDLQEINGLSSEEAITMLYQGGLTIYLTVDTSIQAVIDDVAENGEFWPDLEYETDSETGEQVLASDQIQAAMVLMNFKGEVLGVSGGIRGKEVSRGSNYALLPRNTGSSIKPIASYGPALEVDAITYSTMFADQAVMTLNGQEWPRNYDHTYGSSVTVYDGVRRSLNTIAVRVLQLIGPDFAFDFLTTNLGVTTLADSVQTSSGIVSDRGLGLTLGDLTYGISPLEMAAAFQVFGNGGTYYTPHTYTRIVNTRGEVVLDKTKNIQEIQAISEDTAMIMNKILQGVITSGTGTSARYGSMPLAGKTGTSSDNSDFWCIAMNPYYVMSVWEGYVPTVKYMTTIRPHPTQLAFKAVMSEVSEELEYINFPTSDNVISASYCTSTGNLASDACPSVATGWYKRDNVPGYCSHVFVEEIPAEA
ncbi:MAG: transglycosylase domain-containing protein [Oscillospiraceae bacterium]|nr:transglycosylase domain-containing protein [Oscillospiraceae bacterium]